MMVQKFILILITINLSVGLCSEVSIFHHWLISWQKIFTVESNAKLAEEPKSISYEVPCGISRSDLEDRIVGGDSTSKGKYPWQISLQQKGNAGNRHYCGGTIIHSQWVLTAAHCVQQMNPNRLLIAAGDYRITQDDATEQYRNVSEIILNKFNARNFKRDIALLKLSEPLEFDQHYVSPICLPDHDVTFKETVEVSGWGLLYENGIFPETLQAVSLQLLDNEICHSIYRGMHLRQLTYKCQICAAASNDHKDSCQGDSGGPLMCISKKDGRYYLCGIVSWGIGCARRGHPGVYTDVSCYTDWIAGIIMK